MSKPRKASSDIRRTGCAAVFLSGLDGGTVGLTIICQFGQHLHALPHLRSGGRPVCRGAGASRPADKTLAHPKRVEIFQNRTQLPPFFPGGGTPALHGRRDVRRYHTLAASPRVTTNCAKVDWNGNNLVAVRIHPLRLAATTCLPKAIAPGNRVARRMIPFKGMRTFTSSSRTFDNYGRKVA